MRSRCLRKHHHAWSYYGGRGITICERWDFFENFFADMGERPEGKSLDRIDVNGNYEPNNCRWATAEQQANGKRNTIFVSIDGKTKPFQEWLRSYGIDGGTVRSRLDRGWPIEVAIKAPAGARYYKPGPQHGNGRRLY